MSAIFKIDQPGWVPAPPPLPAWDRARRDIQLVGTGGPVTFTARDPAGSYLWELISEPPGPVTPIVGPNLPSCQVAFTKTGGYLMRLTVDAGIPGSEDISIRYVGVPLANSQLPIPAFNELDFDNSIDPLAVQGAAEKLTEFFKWVDAHIGSGMGNLPQTLTVYVDGGRTDVYVEDGTFAFPFKTIQPAIALAQTLADAASGEACVHIRPFLYDEVDTFLPSNVHIDAEPGSVLQPSVPSHGLIVIPGNFNTSLGVTWVRGLTFAGNGGGIWPNPFPRWGLYLPAMMPPPGVNPPTVAPIDCGIGALQNACGICVESGAVYLSDAGGTYSESAGGTNAIAVRVGSPGGPPPFGAIVVVGMYNLNASETMFDIHPGGAVLAAGTNLSNNTGPLSDAVVRINGGVAPGLGAIFVGRELRFNGDAASMVKETGNAAVLLDTLAGGLPAMGSFTGDIFDIRQGMLNLTGGVYSTNGGNGLALHATDGPVSCWTRDTDIIADKGIDDVQALLTENTVNLQTYNTRFRGGSFVPGRTYARMGHTAGWAYLDGGNIEGGSGGGPPPATILDVMPNSNVWLTGGIDINATHAQDIALNVQALATVFHGHANIRMGHVVMAGTEMPLTSSFANLSLGKYNALTKWTSRATLAEVAGEQGYEHGSIVVVTGGAKPLVYINHGTDLARDWRLLADYVRIQVDQCGSVNLNGTTRIAPAYLPWGHADYDDNPPYAFTAPSTVITLSEDGDYRLSYNVPWQTDALLAFGTSIGVMWEYRPPAGAWTEIPNTLTFDTAANIVNDRGCNDLPSYEKFFTAGTELRVKAFIDTGVAGNVYINNDPAENWAWARVEKGGVGGSGGGAVTDWTVEFVTANRILDATDHKKTLVVLVDSPGTVTITLPVTPFVGQEIRIVHGGQLTYPGPGAGHLTVFPAAPGDKGIGVADSDYAQLDSDGGGAVVHLLCIDSGGGYWGSRFWGCGDGSGIWWDASHLGSHPAPPYDANQFFLNFQSPFRAGVGGHSAIQLYEQSSIAEGVFSFAFGYIVNTSREYSLAFGHLARTNWVGESAFASGGFFSWGSAQRSEVNLYGETTPMDPTGAITPTGIGGLPLTVEPEKVYACELLVAAVRAPYFPMDPPLASGWKLEFLVHGRDLGQNAVIVGTTNKLQFSRDPSPIIDTWDVNVSMGGPGPFTTDILVTVTQGADVGGAVRWDAVLKSAQVVSTIPT
jgi:hypothetical protein